jgi:ribosomal protein S18 acetylase RimI-like enzyme
MTPEDAEEIEELEILLFPDDCVNSRTLRGLLSRGFGYVAETVPLEHGGEKLIRGYALCVTDGELTDLFRIGVYPERQGQGIGSYFMADIIDRNPRVSLMVRKGNEVAIKMYLNWGFEIVGATHCSWVMLRTSSS